jgi:hypothetical protein
VSDGVTVNTSSSQNSNQAWLGDKVPIGYAIDGNELFIVKSLMVKNSEGIVMILHYIVSSETPNP